MIKNVAWGYVPRDIGGGREILVAKRMKPDDPLRYGELVLPGGGICQGESYSDAAMREVLEETGINTVFDLALDFKPGKGIYTKPDLFGHVDANAFIRLTYTDSGKMYHGRLVLLVPVDPLQNPVEQPDSDAREPRYIALQEAFERQGEFTPACQVLLDIIMRS